MPSEARSFWKGHLRLSLVTIPVRLVTAVASDGLFSFHQVDRVSKQRIRYQKVAPGRGPVEKDDIVRGYEVEPGNYVLFEDEELDALKLETRHTIELSEFVPLADIDPVYFDQTYYVLPEGDIAEEGYRVIREALASVGKCGVGQLTIRGKEALVIVRASGPGMSVTTLHYRDEVRQAEDIFKGLERGKLAPDLVQMAKHLIETKSTTFDASKYRSHYAEALKALVERKLSTGKSVAVSDDDEVRAPKVIDFMEALRRSVAARDAMPTKAQPPKPAAKQAKTAAKRTSERATPARGRKRG